MKLNFLAFLAAFALVGCAGNPLKVAETTNQKAFASYGTFVVLEERAASLMRDPSIPISAKRKIQQTDAKVKPVADAAIPLVMESTEAVQNFQACKEQGGDCNTLKGTMVYLAGNVANWISTFKPILKEFESAVRGAN